MRVAGIMSGTSLDGIDVAIVDIKGRSVETIAFHSQPYPAKVREALMGVSDCEAQTGEVARLHFLLAELYAEAFAAACRTSRVPKLSADLIGCHGQTIYHQGRPAPYLGRRVSCTLQIGDGSVLAQRTGIPVVCDFRPADMAVGGQGAPLVPFVDWLLLRHRSRNRVALNIGGIANITVLPANCAPGAVRAFDTGPGNMVIDALVSRFSNGRERFDRNGHRAARGLVQPQLLASLLNDSYYRQRPPKSAGREQYGGAFVERILASGLTPDDAVATATALTAATIAEGIYAFGSAGGTAKEVVVSGGGVHNPVMLRFLRAELPEARILSSADCGIDPDAKEAIAFAVLAHETWRHRPGNLPSATGATRPVILGKICR